MKTGKDGIYLLHAYEGCKLTAYQCSAGKWTIGYGHTGKDVKPGMTITQEQAEQMFASRLAREFEPGVIKALAGTTVNQREFDSLVCFAYNVGVASLQESTLLRKLKAGDKAGAADQFLRWDKAGGKRLLGLYRRRVSERCLFLGNDGGLAYQTGQAIKVLP